MGDAVRERILRSLFWCALPLYLLSFLLPAVGMGTDVFPGWFCAILSVELIVGGWHTLELWLPGLVNLAMLAYLLLKLRGRAPRTRLGLSVSILFVSVPVTCCTLFPLTGFRPRAGYFVWVLSMAGLVVGEFVPKRVPRTDAAGE